MKKQITLNESQLRQIIEKTIKTVLNEKSDPKSLLNGFKQTPASRKRRYSQIRKQILQDKNAAEVCAQELDNFYEEYSEKLYYEMLADNTIHKGVDPTAGIIDALVDIIDNDYYESGREYDKEVFLTVKSKTEELRKKYGEKAFSVAAERCYRSWI